MKIVTDRAANWRLEVECSDCNSVLEIACADVGCRAATDDDPSGFTTEDDVPAVFVATCAACKGELLLVPHDVPTFVERAARERDA